MTEVRKHKGGRPGAQEVITKLAAENSRLNEENKMLRTQDGAKECDWGKAQGEEYNESIRKLKEELEQAGRDLCKLQGVEKRVLSIVRERDAQLESEGAEAKLRGDALESRGGRREEDEYRHRLEASHDLCT